MSDPAHALQDAVYGALQGDPIVRALTGGNIFDRVQPGDGFPRVTIGQDQIVDDGDSCGDGWQAFVQVHVWVREGWTPVAKHIAGAVRDVLAAPVPIAVPGFRVLSGLHRDTVYLHDQDGVTVHAALSFEYLIDPA